MTDPQPLVTDPLLTQEEAAKYLSTTVHQLSADRRARRTIPYVKVGRLVRYRKSQLDRYINQQSVGGLTD